MFHRRLSNEANGPIGVDLTAVLEVALEVAEAVSYMHSIRLCHGDIKVGWCLLVGAGCCGGWWSDCRLACTSLSALQSVR
jgi:hypothetical protein